MRLARRSGAAPAAELPPGRLRRACPTLFGAPGRVGEMAAEAARLRDMHPSDVAGVVRALPLAQRKQLAEAMDDERLADLLEELPEAEQLRIIEGLDLERLINVLEEMEYDDLADLLAEMPGEQRTRILDAMDDEDADVMRRLLAYEDGTAGALMTPEIIILGPTATVAEALAEIRDPDWLVSIAAQVFVVQPPYKPPTGTYLGVVHFQRLLREPPSMELGRCLEQEPTIAPDLPRARGRRAAGQLQHAGRRRLRRGRPPARRDHRRRRARPHPAHRLAPAPAGRVQRSVATDDAPRRPHHPAPAPPASGCTTTPRRSAGSASRSPAASAPPGSSSIQTRDRASSGSCINVRVRRSLRFDEYPFILLNLAVLARRPPTPRR